MKPLRMGRMAALAAVLTAVLAQGQEHRPAPAASRPFRVMTWNVENLFDTVHDAGKQDWEFLPSAQHRWTSGRFWRKLTDIGRVVAAVADGEGLAEGGEGMPDLIALCEVENDSVLTTLTRRSALRAMDYSYVMTDGPDERGIDVALLYQRARFRLIDSRSVRVPCHERGLRPTRDMLVVRGAVITAGGIDTLHVVVAHLPSRAGGHQADRSRRLAAATLWQTVDSLLAADERAHIVVAGDFNADRHDRIFRHAPLSLTDGPTTFLRQRGSYCFQGFWQWLDHILVSASVRPRSCAQPVELPWLLEPNKSYGGLMPYRTFRGPVYHGGVSDHLPLVLDIDFIP